MQDESQFMSEKSPEVIKFDDELDELMVKPNSRELLDILIAKRTLLSEYCAIHQKKVGELNSKIAGKRLPPLVFDDYTTQRAKHIEAARVLACRMGRMKPRIAQLNRELSNETKENTNVNLEILAELREIKDLLTQLVSNSTPFEFSGSRE